MGSIALCIDEGGAKALQDLGVDAADAAWLTVVEGAESARRHIREHKDLEEAWVLSGGCVGAINLAAAIRKDNADMRTVLIAPEITGSVMSRVKAADIHEVMPSGAMARRLQSERSRRRGTGRPAEVSIRRDGIEAQQTAPMAASLAGLHGIALPSDAGAGSRNAYTMAVVSGGGGAGKSAFCALAGFAAASAGLKTLLLDADLQFGDLAALCGLKDPLTVEGVLSDPSLFEALAQGSAAAGGSQAEQGLWVLAAPVRLEDSDVFAAHIPGLLEALTSHFDLIVANTGSGWSDLQPSLIERCAKTLFLMDQRISSVRACRHALDLCLRCGMASGSFDFAVNRCSKRSSFGSIDVSCALQGVHVHELKDGGYEVEEMLGAGLAGALSKAHEEFGSSVRSLLEECVPGFGAKGPKAREAPKGALPRVNSRKERRSRRRRIQPDEVPA